MTKEEKCLGGLCEISTERTDSENLWNYIERGF